MTNQDFYTLFGAAIAEPDEDRYIAEWGTSSIFYSEPDEDGPETDDVVRQLREIWRTAHMAVRDIRKAAGLTQAGLAAHFCIPRRTVEDWDSGRSNCAPYIRLMMAEALGIVKIDRS